MNIACHYAIVRFMPFVETGEFGNVGVVLFAPNARHFGFQLLGNRIARITHFFDQVEGQTLRNCIRNAREELQRIHDLLRGLGTDKRLKHFDRENAPHLWQQILKPSESMIRFSEPRVVLAQDPQAKLKELFEYYVERNFVTKEYKEHMLDRSVRGWLREASVHNLFHPARIGNDEYNAQFPFVSLQDEVPTKAIKPLRLDHSNAASVIDHGGQWRIRVEALKKRNLLPANLLFAVNGNFNDQLTPVGRARAEVIENLRYLGANVEPMINRQAIVDFAVA
ncbi:MAG: DUF3037 domain-containing protein [Cytophagales bacterium]|nr:DUF3037 domain-containing protein [Cytophagales bacterium]